MEAAIVLPLFLLVILTLVLCMIYQYECHHAQTEMHRQLLDEWDRSAKVMDIERRTAETSSETRGIVDRWLSREKESRIYICSPAECIRLGEMLSFDEE